MNPSAPREWGYSTSDDAQAAINTAGYFNDASDLLTVGDIIRATDSAGSKDVYFVNANSAGVVDVDNGTAYDGGTDSD
jgi:hypothetical protein